MRNERTKIAFRRISRYGLALAGQNDDAISFATTEDWERAWNSDSTATYYQSYEWAKLWAQLAPEYEPVAASVRLRSGLKVIVPLLRQRTYRGLITAYQSNPMGTQTGWLAPRALAPSEVEELVTVVRSQLDDLDWKTSPLQHGEGTAQPMATAYSRLVDLRAGADAVRAQWSKGHKAAYNKGVRLGVQVRRADEPEEWHRFWELYQDTIRRWEAAGEPVTSRYDRALFEALRCADGARLWVAERNGEILSAAVFLYAPRTAVYFHGASSGEALDLRPNNVLFPEVMFQAAADGADWADLGASGGHEKVDEFKRRFGAVLAPFGSFVQTSRRHRIIRALRAVPGRWLDA